MTFVPNPSVDELTIQNGQFSIIIGPNGREMVQVGDPTITSARERLIRLLHIGAAIEHALMVQYLYAAYSLDAIDLPSTAPPAQLAAIKRWQAEILAIAKEEMGHLISVQNVLLLLGSPICLARENYPWDSQFYPFEFRLEPLSRGSLAAYVVAEMPENWVKDLQALLVNGQLFIPADGASPDSKVRAQVVMDVRDHMKLDAAGLRGLGVNRVGALFRSILAILEDHEELLDREFLEDNYFRQATHSEWGRNHPQPQKVPPGSKVDPPGNGVAQVIVEPMSTRDQAIAALKAVAEQGESRETPTDAASYEEIPSQQSHFQRFLRIYEEWRALNLPIAIASKVPLTPTEAPADPRRGGGSPVTPITDARSSRWAKLFNLRYRILLTTLACSLESPRQADVTGQPGLRGTLTHLCFGEMYNLKAISQILLRSPLTAPNDPKRAGPPFQMPYDLALPQADADRLRALLDLLDTSMKLTDWLVNFQGRPEEMAYLNHVRAIDRDTRVWVDRQITRLTIARGQA